MTEEPNITPAAEGPTLAHIASRVLNRPLLLHPDKADLVLHVLQGRIGLDRVGPMGPDANRFIGTYRREDGRAATMRVQNGVAILPIVGSLVNRGAWIGASSGLVSYEGISAQLREAAADPEVSAIMLDIDSPGGEATGMFSVANLVRQVNQTKPVVAMVNDVAASAAYGIASGASEIVVSPTSMVGSIGVVLTHLDRSGELEQKGVKATLIYAGKHKVDGHPFGELSASVKADLQAEVAKFYDQFVGLVAVGRAGRMTDADIRATEARTYLGADAVEIGLADRVASIDEVLSGLSSTAHGATTQRTGIGMTKTTDAAPQAENAGITEAEMNAATETARAEGMAAGKAEATTRIKSILTSEEATGREAQAMVLALDTDMSAEDASKVLAASPKATGAASLEQRAREGAEFGGNDAPIEGASQKAASIWGAAVKDANASIGVKS